MVHSDDNGLVLPPRIASSHIVFLPIYKTDEERDTVLEYINTLKARIKDLGRFHERRLVIETDDRDIRGGEKDWHWIKKGIPLKVEIGMKDIEKDSVAVLRRDNPELKKEFINKDLFIDNLHDTLDDIQNNLFNKAKTYLDENTRVIDNRDEFESFFTPKNSKNPEIHGGFASSHWCGSVKCEEELKDLKITIRNIPLDSKAEAGKCICCGEDSNKRVIFAKAY